MHNKSLKSDIVSGLWPDTAPFSAALALYLLESAVEKIVVDFDEEDIAAIAPPEEALRAKETLKARCNHAGLEVKEDVRDDGNSYLKIGMRCAREQRWLLLVSDENWTTPPIVDNSRLISVHMNPLTMRSNRSLRSLGRRTAAS